MGQSSAIGLNLLRSLTASKLRHAEWENLLERLLTVSYTCCRATGQLQKPSVYICPVYQHLPSILFGLRTGNNAWNICGVVRYTHFHDRWIHSILGSGWHTANRHPGIRGISSCKRDGWGPCAAANCKVRVHDRFTVSVDNMVVMTAGDRTADHCGHVLTCVDDRPLFNKDDGCKNDLDVQDSA